MRIFRIADSRHPVWSGTGAMLVGGRFNSRGHPVIYGAPGFAGAMLEVLMYTRIGKVPRHHVWVETGVPDDVPVEQIDAGDLPAGWDGPDLQVARGFGDRWLSEARSAVLVVPSVVPSVVARAEPMCWSIRPIRARCASWRPCPSRSCGTGGSSPRLNERLLNRLTSAVTFAPDTCLWPTRNTR